MKIDLLLFFKSLLRISSINWHKSIYYCFSSHFKFVRDFQYKFTQIDLLFVFQVISNLLGISSINSHKSIYYCFSSHFKIWNRIFIYILTQEFFNVLTKHSTKYQIAQIAEWFFVKFLHFLDCLKTFFNFGYLHWEQPGFSTMTFKEACEIFCCAFEAEWIKTSLAFRKLIGKINAAAIHTMGLERVIGQYEKMKRNSRMALTTKTLRDMLFVKINMPSTFNLYLVVMFQSEKLETWTFESMSLSGSIWKIKGSPTTLQIKFAILGSVNIFAQYLLRRS